MEIYVLDDLLRRETVVDRFVSLIWTERYNAYGDFQLVIHSNVQSRQLLGQGEMLAINGSDRVMVIENVEDKDDSDGRSLLTLTGRSLEAIMERRVNSGSPFDTGAGGANNYNATGTPGAIARNQFDAHCRNNTKFPGDNIPFITTGSLYPAGTIAEPDTTITMVIDRNDVYTAVKNICDIYGLGFRLYRGPDTSKLYFDIYTGNDLTTAQTSKPAVIFSPDLENLTNIAQLSSIENYKNVAYVLAPNGSRVVYSNNVDASVSGFDRRVLFVDASDITTAAGTALNDALDLRGAQELAKNKSLTALDGEIPQNGKYRYRVDYNLGDILEMRNNDGVTNRMRVTEQIFVDDEQGERSYPTLKVEEFITPGSWSAWDINGVWDTAAGVWAFVPDGDKYNDNLLVNGGGEYITSGGVPGSIYEWTGVLDQAGDDGVIGSANIHSGTYAFKATTTAVNTGPESDYTVLTASPTGTHNAEIWIKASGSGQSFSFYMWEKTTTGAIVQTTTAVTVSSTGAWQKISATINKTGEANVIGIKLTKAVAGVFYFDDAVIWIP